jgi:hypothetical protein
VNNKALDEIMNGYPAYIDLHKVYYSYIFMNPGHFLVDPM